ncbi:MAG TPA: adenosylcobinamide-GDP ribazoletransferase [Thermoanaerobaculia bacterium]|nr:adenosylcobinamide-GDP ribazoletransferase [Thermoanaerobaculia bacterium]
MSLAASHAELYARMAVKDPADDGRFFIGVLSTGIYCRPSCRARLPKPENVRFFSTAQEAERAGLRACLRCRPDEFSAGREPELERIEALVDGLRADPTAFADSAALARLAGVGLSKLHALSRQHFQTSPAELVASARLERARRLLAETTKPILEVAWDSGFSSLSTFQGNFTRRHGLSPGEYRKLLGAREFELRLPQPYPLPTLLGYLGRDGESPVERVRGTAYAAGAWLAGRFGGLTGDCYGALVELTEAAVLLAAAGLAKHGAESWPWTP